MDRALRFRLKLPHTRPPTMEAVKENIIVFRGQWAAGPDA